MSLGTIAVLLLGAIAAGVFVFWLTAPTGASRETSQENAHNDLLEDELDEIDAYWGDAQPDSLLSEMPAATATRRVAADPRVDDPDRSSIAERAHGLPGCQLGAGLLHEMLEQRHILPNARGRITLRDQARAHAALARNTPTLVLGHGGVLQRVGKSDFLLIEPCVDELDAVDAVLGKIVERTRGGHVTLLIGTPDPEMGPEVEAHLPKLVRSLNIQPDATFVTHGPNVFGTLLEDQRDFVPSFLDAARIPESFVAEMVEYGRAALENNNPEIPLRICGPLADTLWQRACVDKTFDEVAFADMLELLGDANRATTCTLEAVICYDYANSIWKAREVYSHVLRLELALGATMLECGSADPEALKASTKHIQSAIHLDEDNIEAWRLLATAFEARFETEQQPRLRSRADRAWRKVDALEAAQKAGPNAPATAGPKKAGVQTSAKRAVSPALVGAEVDRSDHERGA